MKYEDQYDGSCFDFLFMNDGTHETLDFILKRYYSVDILNKDEFRYLIFKAIEEAHDKDYIRPLKEK